MIPKNPSFSRTTRISVEGIRYLYFCSSIWETAGWWTHDTVDVWIFWHHLGWHPQKTSDFQSDFLKTFQRGHMTSVNITRKPHLLCLSCSSKIGPLDQVQTKWLYLSKNPLARMGLGSQDSLTVSLGRCRILLHAIFSTDFRVLTKLPTTKLHVLFVHTGFDPSKCPATVLASSLIPPKMDGTFDDSCQKNTWATKKNASDTFHQDIGEIQQPTKQWKKHIRVYSKTDPNKCIIFILFNHCFQKGCSKCLKQIEDAFWHSASVQ